MISWAKYCGSEHVWEFGDEFNHQKQCKRKMGVELESEKTDWFLFLRQGFAM